MAGVTSSYPAALDSESNLTPPNNGDTLSVADHWLAGNSGPIVAIETELGTDPSGYATDVKTRLNTINPSSGLLAANGLQFPGTQSPSADANTLDDYEEGTWTGNFTATTSGPSTSVTTTGTYTKVGNLVFANIRFTNVDTTGASGYAQITGLPFVCGDDVVGAGYMNRAGSNTDSKRSNIDFFNVITFLDGHGNALTLSSAGTGTFLAASLTYIIS